jgi:hypothetical protein
MLTMLVALLAITSPVWAAKPAGAGAGGAGGGNSGDVKVVDALTGADESPSNDPHVCSF